MILAATGLLLIYYILANPNYSDTFEYLLPGVLLTLRITLSSYAIAIVVGLLVGLARTSKNLVLYTIGTLYVQTARGVPLIVLMLYVAFVMVPIVVSLVQAIGTWGLSLGIASMQSTFTRMSDPHLIRSISLETRAVVALAFGYGAFEAEVFRAGIQSIGRGQMEAARSLGMTYYQAMRLVILPQAVRRVLPPLGNDFIACLKDSSLATVLAVNELTQLGRLRRASTFRVFETFNVVAYLYLSMTLVLSSIVQLIERRMKFEE
jgi:polar amino acid transport system permease protein